MGWKQWTRERLSVTDLQEHIQDQVIARFASASARAAQLPAPEEGMVSYLEDVGRWEGHDGDGWQVLSYGAAPVLRVTRQASPQSLPTGVFTVIAWDTELEDSHGMMTGSAITCKRSGLYAVTAAVHLVGTSGGNRAVDVLKSTGGAAAVGTGVGHKTTSAQEADIGVEATGLARFALDDVITVRGWQNSGVAQNTTNANTYGPTKLDMVWLRA